jgi:hypothetical protein
VTPIERAARVLATANGVSALNLDRQWLNYADDVREVIAAIREPSEGMVTAGEMKTDTYYSQDGDVARGWQAMIDAMLSETP